MSNTGKKNPIRGHAPVLLLAVFTFTLAGAGLGFWIGQYTSAPAVAKITIDRSAANRTLAMGSVESLSPTEIDALAARLGELQAQLMRINALGERLVEMSGLDPEEFDFQNPPPQGGPDMGLTRDYTIKELASELASVVRLIQDRDRKLDILQDIIVEKDLTAQALPTGWPVRSGYISSTYGFRVHPVRRARHFHNGVDLASPRGAPVLAVADGIVTFSGRKGGYGNVVDVRHIDGLVTRYGHNSANLVRVGQMVRQGQKIATVGATGTATGPHVHFEVRKDDRPIDPMPYLRSRPRQTLASASLDRAD